MDRLHSFAVPSSPLRSCCVIDQITAGAMAFTLHIEDPMANSFVYSPYAPGPDPRLEVWL